MNVDELIISRIEECRKECASYSSWIRKLRFPNVMLVGGGSLLAFLGGATILADSGHTGSTAAGIMALVGGALTGFHSWFGCEAHQAECIRLVAQFDSFKARYEMIQAEPDHNQRLDRLRELEKEFADAKEGRKARPWKGLLDFSK
jgi:hypothetical protein